METPVLFRRSEYVLVLYYAYTLLLALTLQALGRLRPGVMVVTLAVNLFLIATLRLLAHAESLRHYPLLAGLRFSIPLPLMLLSYREMGWFAPASHSYGLERGWIVWDRMVLHDWGLKRAIESMGTLIPTVLEISYLLVYAIATFSVLWLVAHMRWDRLDAFYFQALLGLLLSYVLFPFFPSEPPRSVFAGEDLPLTTAIRPYTLELLGGYGIHTSVFPSAHVSGAFSTAWVMCRVSSEERWVGRLLVVLATLIAVATVYGRYHYVVDALAGLGVAVVADVISRKYGPPAHA